ncbi:T9SS type A sorting domain-containing protein [Psychroserpens jangbogonensis]|uniref:T9SS type A sorting domain-containing protein n=1 Tax=Psychroserpens jangbogonensis TaxID=1484460 RepID=UPI00053D2E8D|nr:T9SS type A sorting domain-containing protein [Psychroserpens jangbogonensis]
MKHIYTLIITILITNFTLAQADLFVSSGSFIFVDGSGFTSAPNVAPLYVTDDISLNTNGFIYLRNQAQLIQGNNIGNSGLGRLSVFQNGTVHNWAYNYWCSPVGNVFEDDGTTPLNNSVNNPFKAFNQLFDFIGDPDPALNPITSNPATFITGYNGVSTPLQISNRWIYTFNPGTVYSEWDYIAHLGNANPGYGFTMKGTSGSGNNQLYDFRGKANNGTMTTSVLNGELTLVGNPYPSAMDARAYIWDSTNRNSISGTLFFWEQDLSVNSHYLAQYVGGYATYTINELATLESFISATFDTYNADGTTLATGPSSTSSKRVYRYIPIGQGFMIEGNSANTTARTNNAMRIFVKKGGTQSEFFRTTENTTISYDDLIYNEDGLQIIPDDYKRFRINIDFNETYTRQLLHNFHQSATSDFDYGLESKSSSSIDSDGYWVLNDEAYVAQAHDFSIDLRIPVVVKLSENQPLRFRIFDIQNFDDSQPIYLHDTETNLYVDLRQQNYGLNLDQGVYDNRFVITFSNEDTLSNEEVTVSDFIVFQDNNNSQLTIKNPNSISINKVTLFDVSGKQVFNATDLDHQDTYRFSTKNLSDGIYVTVISLDNNNTLSKKLVIKNK